MAEQSAHDFLRESGISEETLTRIGAVMDQSGAEADHLISHAVDLVTAPTNAEAIFIGFRINAHLTDMPEKPRGLIAALLWRIGLLGVDSTKQALRITQLKDEVAQLTDQVAKQASGRSTWWRKGRA